MFEDIIDKIGDWYSWIIAEYPVLVLSLIIASAVFSGILASHLKITAYEYKHTIINDPIVDAMFKVEDEFSMSSSSVIILISSRDVRDPSVLEYMNKIDTAVQTVPGVASVNSPAEEAKRICGRLPKTYADSIACFNKKIVIKPVSVNLQDKLVNVSEGLEKAGKLLKTESVALNEMSNGLNRSSSALLSISEGLGESASAMRTPTLSFGSELGETLGKLYLAIMNSNATLEQKQEELAYISKIEEILGQIQALSEESLQNMEKFRVGLSDTSSALTYIALGIQNASKGSHQLGYMDNELSASLIQISHGLKGILPYISIFEQDNGKEETIDPFSNLVSPDNRTARIMISLYSLPKDQQEDIGDEIKNIVSRIQKPPHTTVQITGAPVMSREIKTSVKEDMSKTSTVSMIAIIFIVVLLFRSIKNGLTSLMAIVFGSIWAYGIIALLGVNISQTSSGALSMIFGVGIDFGIQVVNRFREEIQKEKDLQKALKHTVVNVGKPMTITAVSILIGFKAMSLGQLKTMSELGDIMSLGVFFSYLAALLVVPTVLAILYKHSHKK